MRNDTAPMGTMTEDELARTRTAKSLPTPVANAIATVIGPP